MSNEKLKRLQNMINDNNGLKFEDNRGTEYLIKDGKLLWKYKEDSGWSFNHLNWHREVLEEVFNIIEDMLSGKPIKPIENIAPIKTTTSLDSGLGGGIGALFVIFICVLIVFYLLK